MNQFLICHRGALGDFILTWPALQALRQILPGFHFCGLGRPEYMRLAMTLGLLDSCHHAESSEMVQFFSGRSIPPRLGSPLGAILWLAEGRAAAELLTKSASLPVALIPPFPSNQMHVGIYHWLAVTSHFPIESSPALFPCFPLNVKRGTYALIHPGSGSPGKNYHPQFYLALADELRKRGFPEVRFILGPAEERQLIHYLAGEKIEQPSDVEALARLQAGASLYIGNDSGVSHLSGVLGTPTIALYKVTDPQVWGVLGRTVTHLKARNEDLAWDGIRECLRQFRPP